MSAFRNKARDRAGRKVLAEVQFDGECLQVMEPLFSDRLEVLDAAKKAGDLDDDNAPRGMLGAARLSAHIVIALCRRGGKPYFDAEDVLGLVNASGFDALAGAVAPYFHGEPTETTLGKSEAGTPEASAPSSP